MKNMMKYCLSVYCFMFLQSCLTWKDQLVQASYQNSWASVRLGNILPIWQGKTGFLVSHWNVQDTIQVKKKKKSCKCVFFENVNRFLFQI